MNVKWIRSGEKKEIMQKLEEQFGISELPYLLFEAPKDKIRAFSGSMTREELWLLGSFLNVNFIGIPLLKKEDSDFKIGFDAIHLLKEQITKGIVEINKEQLEQWIRGKDLEITSDSKFVIIKYKSDFIGYGKSTGEKILNHVPKERRIRK